MNLPLPRIDSLFRICYNSWESITFPKKTPEKKGYEQLF